MPWRRCRRLWFLPALPLLVTAKYFGFYEVRPDDIPLFDNTTNLYQASSIADALEVKAYNQQSLLLVFDIFFAAGKLRGDWQV